MTHSVKLKKRYPPGGDKSCWTWVLRYWCADGSKEIGEVIGWYAPARDGWEPKWCKGPRLTETQADEIRVQRRNDLREGRVGKPEAIHEKPVNDPETMPFSKWREIYVEETKGTVRASTLREIKRALKCLDTLITPRIAKAVDHQTVKRFIQARLGENAKRSTVFKDVSCLRRVWYDAHIQPNPWAGQKLRKLLKSAPKGWHWYQPEEFAKLIAKCDEKQNRKFKEPDNKTQGERIRYLRRKWLGYKGMIGLAYTCGLRLGEIDHLAWADVHLEAGEIEISPKDTTDRTVKWNPKDNERRIVPLVPTVKAMLEELQKTAGEGNPYVFVQDCRYQYIIAQKDTWPEGRYLLNNVHRDFVDLCKAAEVTVDEFHSLRKSCCTNLLEGGVVPHAVQKIMGHADLETTIKYYSKVRRDQITTAREVSEAYLNRKPAQPVLRIKTA